MKTTIVSSSLTLEDAVILDRHVRNLPITVSSLIKLLLSSALKLDDADFEALTEQPVRRITEILRDGVRA